MKKNINKKNIDDKVLLRSIADLIISYKKSNIDIFDDEIESLIVNTFPELENIRDMVVRYDVESNDESWKEAFENIKDDETRSIFISAIKDY